MLGNIIAVVGLVLTAIAHLWVAVAAFQKGILWGLAVLCIPLVALVFIILNWSELKGAVWLYVLGLLASGLGGALVQRNQQRQLRELPNQTRLERPVKLTAG